MHPLPQLRVRAATDGDCEAMSAVRAASITRLCSADHNDDPHVIAAWAGNQSPQTFRALLSRPDVSLIVAELDGAVVGVGGLSGEDIKLNYVDPDHQFQGISKALMAALEGQMAASGVVRARLYSTATARGFYRAIGWIDEDGATPESGYPMSKVLIADA